MSGQERFVYVSSNKQNQDFKTESKKINNKNVILSYLVIMGITLFSTIILEIREIGFDKYESSDFSGPSWFYLFLSITFLMSFGYAITLFLRNFALLELKNAFLSLVGYPFIGYMAIGAFIYFTDSIWN